MPAEWLRSGLGARVRRRLPRLWGLASAWYWRSAARMPLLEPPLFGQLRRVAADVRPARGAPPVLFFSTRQQRDQVTITTVLGQSLLLRGEPVVALHCDQVLFHSCNTGAYPALTAERCEACYRFTRRARDLAGVPTIWLSAYVTAADWRDAQAAVDAIAPEAYEGFQYEGLPLGRLVRHSVGHFLRTDGITADPESLAFYRRWLIAGIVVARACRRVLAEQRPRVVVMLSGHFMPERVCYELAREAGIRVVTYEVGASSETAVFGHNLFMDYDLPEEWEWARRTPLTASQRARVDERLAERRRGRSYLYNYHPDPEEDRERIMSRLGLAADRSIATLFTNLTWDSAVFEKDLFFEGIEDWLVDTVELYRRRPAAQLVVRVHPAEAMLEAAARDPIRGRLMRRVGTLPPNVSFVDAGDPISSYTLFDLSDFVVVYTSTIGLETALAGKPTIVCGQVHYRGKGFTIDPSDRGTYQAAIDSLISTPRPLAASELDLAYRYAHFFLFEAARPLAFMRYSLANDIPELRIVSAADLAPGKDAVLDRICDAIVTGGSFIHD